MSNIRATNSPLGWLLFVGISACYIGLENETKTWVKNYSSGVKKNSIFRKDITLLD